MATPPAIVAGRCRDSVSAFSSRNGIVFSEKYIGAWEDLAGAAGVHRTTANRTIAPETALIRTFIKKRGGHTAPPLLVLNFRLETTLEIILYRELDHAAARGVQRRASGQSVLIRGRKVATRVRKPQV